LLGGRRRPSSGDDPGTKLERALDLRVVIDSVEAPHDSDLAGCREVVLRAADHLPSCISLDFDHGNVNIQLGQFLGEDRALDLADHRVQFDLEVLEVIHGAGR
jgi:hypothetical protein